MPTSNKVLIRLTVDLTSTCIKYICWWNYLLYWIDA